MSGDAKPTGPDAVRAALLQATIDLIIEQGTGTSVREVAARAGVNHGLVHKYFGSKQALFAAAYDEVNRRAGEDVDDDGFPFADAAQRRNGELGKTIARMQLDSGRNLFSNHPMASAWQQALAEARPDLDRKDIEKMVAKASAVALGWAVFGDHLAATLDLSAKQRGELALEINALVVELGGLPPRSPD